MRFNPEEYRKRPRKMRAHTAMSDIEESFNELKYYNKHFFVKPNRR